MSKYTLDAKALYAALDRQREAAQLSWRQLGKQLGLASSAFTRMQEGGTPSADALVTMLTWLEVDYQRYVKRPA